MSPSALSGLVTVAESDGVSESDMRIFQGRCQSIDTARVPT